MDVHGGLMSRNGGVVGAAVRPCKQQHLPVKASCTCPAHHDLWLSLQTDILHYEEVCNRLTQQTHCMDKLGRHKGEVGLQKIHQLPNKTMPPQGAMHKSLFF